MCVGARRTKAQLTSALRKKGRDQRWKETGVHYNSPGEETGREGARRHLLGPRARGWKGREGETIDSDLQLGWLRSFDWRNVFP